MHNVIIQKHHTSFFIYVVILFICHQMVHFYVLAILLSTSIQTQNLYSHATEFNSIQIPIAQICHMRLKTMEEETIFGYDKS